MCCLHIARDGQEELLDGSRGSGHGDRAKHQTQIQLQQDPGCWIVLFRFALFLQGDVASLIIPAWNSFAFLEAFPPAHSSSTAIILPHNTAAKESEAAVMFTN